MNSIRYRIGDHTHMFTSGHDRRFMIDVCAFGPGEAAHWDPVTDVGVRRNDDYLSMEDVVEEIIKRLGAIGQGAGQ